MFDEGQKSFSCLKSLSRRGPVNPSTPTFGNINLTEAMNVIFLLLGNSIKNDCKKWTLDFAKHVHISVFALNMKQI